MNINDAADIIGAKPGGFIDTQSASFTDRMNAVRAEDIAGICLEMRDMSQASVLHALTMAWQAGAMFAYRDIRRDER